MEYFPSRFKICLTLFRSAAMFFREGKFPAGLEKDEVDGCGAYFDGFSGSVGFAGGASDQNILGFIIDKIIVLQLRDMEKAFEHEVVQFKGESKRFDAGDDGIIDF